MGTRTRNEGQGLRTKLETSKRYIMNHEVERREEGGRRGMWH